MKNGNSEQVEKLEHDLQKLSDEEVLKVLLHAIRERFRSKKIRNIAVLQEIIRELNAAGI